MSNPLAAEFQNYVDQRATADLAEAARVANLPTRAEIRTADAKAFADFINPQFAAMETPPEANTDALPADILTRMIQGDVSA